MFDNPSIIRMRLLHDAMRYGYALQNRFPFIFFGSIFFRRQYFICGSRSISILASCASVGTYATAEASSVTRGIWFK